MNSTIDVWAHVLSPESMLTGIKTSAEVRFAGSKKIPEHDKKVKTASVVNPDETYLVIADDSYGLKCVFLFRHLPPDRT